MKIPELFHHLEYFSSEDYTQFGKFLKSPYYNSIKAYGIIFATIKNHKKYVEKKKFAELKSAIVKDTKYSEKTVSKSLSHMSDLFAEFIKVQGLKNEKFYGGYFGCKYLLQKGNQRYLENRVEYINNFLEEQKFYDQDLYGYLFDLNKLKFNAICISEDKFNPLSKLERQKEYTIEASINLYIYSLAHETTNFVNYVMQCLETSDKENKKFPINLENMFCIIDSPEFNSFSNLQKKTVKLYNKLFKLFCNPTEDKLYHEYKNYYNKVKDLYNFSMQESHLTILVNFCSYKQRINHNNSFFFIEGSQLLFQYIDGRYFVDEVSEYLLPTIYRNYVIICLKQKDKNTLKKFIDTQTDKLHPIERKPMKEFALAMYYFMTNNFEQSLNIANKLNNLKSLYKYDIMTLKLKLYYEYRDFENMQSVLTKCTENIKKDDFLTKSDRDRFNYMLYCFNLLIKAFAKYEKKKDVFHFEFLMKKIEVKPSFALKIFLSEKVKAFIDENYKRIKT